MSWPCSTSDGRFTFVSPSAERVLGIDASQAVGTDAIRLFDDDSVEMVAFALRRPGDRTAALGLLECATERPDGTPVDLEVVAAGRLEPRGGIVLSIRDMTDAAVPGTNGPAPGARREGAAPVAERRPPVSERRTLVAGAPITGHRTAPVTGHRTPSARHRPAPGPPPNAARRFPNAPRPSPSARVRRRTWTAGSPPSSSRWPRE